MYESITLLRRYRIPLPGRHRSFLHRRAPLPLPDSEARTGSRSSLSPRATAAASGAEKLVEELLHVVAAAPLPPPWLLMAARPSGRVGSRTVQRAGSVPRLLVRAVGAARGPAAAAGRHGRPRAPPWPSPAYRTRWASSSSSSAGDESHV